MSALPPSLPPAWSKALSVIPALGTKEIAEWLKKPPVAKTARIKDLVALFRTEDKDNVDLALLPEVQAAAASDLLARFSVSGPARKRVVIFGHKNQGKTQLLFYLLHLLQESGEIVFYMEGKKENRDKVFLANLAHWKDKFRARLGAWLQDNWPNFFQDTLWAQLDALNTRDITTFDLFFTTLSALSLNPDLPAPRIWVLVDEVTELSEEFQLALRLPAEQTEDDFHFIITGSNKMATFVKSKHLTKWVWSTSPFTAEQCQLLFLQLSSAMGIDPKQVADDLEAPSVDAIGSRLEELTGGIAGFIAEYMVQMKTPPASGTTMEIISTELTERVLDIISKSPFTMKERCEELYVEALKDRWAFFQDAGLCGSGPPRGLLLSIAMSIIGDHYKDPVQTLLALVSHLRSRFAKDPGLDGCLLEVEQIASMTAGTQMHACRLSLDSSWGKEEPPICLLGQGAPTLLQYTEERPICSVWPTNDPSPAWHVVLLPCCFPVVDVVVLHTPPTSPGHATIYMVQITRSASPFQQHHTHETCSLSSKTRLETLQTACKSVFKITNWESYFVMHAPNSSADGLPPPTGHTSPFFFVVRPGAPPPTGHVAPLSTPFAACCGCISGACKTCKCRKAHRKCKACQSTGCKNK